MEHFFSQYPEVAYAFVAALFGIIAWLIQIGIKDNAEKIRKQEERIDTIENNYKDEFKKIKVDANEKHLEILGILTEVRIEIAQLKGNNIQINKQ